MRVVGLGTTPEIEIVLVWVGDAFLRNQEYLWNGMTSKKTHLFTSPALMTISSADAVKPCATLPNNMTRVSMIKAMPFFTAVILILLVGNLSSFLFPHLLDVFAPPFVNFSSYEAIFSQKSQLNPQKPYTSYLSAAG